MNKVLTTIFIIFISTGYIRCQVPDSASTSDCGTDIPGWLIEKIKEMSLDEKHYAGTKVFEYEIDTFCIYQIANPFSSIAYDLFRWDGSRLDTAAMKMFLERKGEPLLIWENYPAVQFDSLKNNIKVPEE